MHKLGAHQSIVGGHVSAVHRIVENGGNALQMFLASPRGWHFTQISDDDIEAFIADKEKHSIDPVYFHASYLLNLADAGRVGQLSTQLLTHELKLASKMTVKGSIVHLGSYKTNGKDHVNLCLRVQKILEKIPDNVLFIIENAGNNKIGLHIDEIAEIIKELKDKRMRVCLDTCHLHAAGYDLRMAKSFHDFLEAFDTKIGLNKLELWHLNDSRDPFGSLRDRHENIGEGQVGINVFTNILNHPKTKHIPCIIETPGFDGLGPDKKNLDILKKLIKT